MLGLAAADEPDPRIHKALMAAKPQTLNALQALRGCAALLVVADHAIDNMFTKGGAIADPDLLGLGYFLGSLGVAVFFVISGFVMMYAHGDDFGQAGAPSRFAGRRIGRIAPIYWFMTILYAGWLALTHRAPGLIDIGRSLVFWPYGSVGAPYGHPVLGQGWTLDYEAFFYLIFGLALFLRRGLPCVFSVFALLVAGHLSGLFGSENLLAFWSDPITLYFLAGLALGLVQRRARLPLNFYGALGAAVLLLTGAIATAAVVGPNALIGTAVADFCCVAAVATCILAGERPGEGWVLRLAKSLGDATYAIYLSHTLVIALCLGLSRAAGLHPPIALFVFLMLPVTSVVGVALHLSLEKWLMRRWNALFRRPPKSAPKAVTAPA